MRATKGQKRVVLQDIANETGYTVNTVSRALQNKSDIAKSTCAYIQEVADKMGYVRNNLASSLRSGRSRTIAVIVGEASNPFYATMIDSIHGFAEETGYTVISLCSRDDAKQEQKAIITAISHQVDGILLFPSNYATQTIPLMRQAGIPFVMASRYTEHPDYDYVVCDEETGGYLAGKHLIEAGHRKIAFYYVMEVTYSSEHRTNGLLRATREAGIPDEDVYITHRPDPSQIDAMLKQWKAKGVTGIFAFCDIEAWQLATCIASAGMCDDFALVGFDNIQSVISFPSSLCTIDGQMHALARAAYNILIGRIAGDSTPAKHVVFPVQLVCRGSCGIKK